MGHEMAVLVLVLAIQLGPHTPPCVVSADIAVTSGRGGTEAGEVRKLQGVSAIKSNIAGAAAAKTRANQHYLEDFLLKHVRPDVHFDNNGFSLSLGPGAKFEFKPKINSAPFSTSGEPWPMPQHYQPDATAVFVVNHTLNIQILNRTCALLERAVARYTNIIRLYTLEEPYNMPYNFHPGFRRQHENAARERLQAALPLAGVTVQVADVTDGYPQPDMDESYNVTVESGWGRIVARQVWGALRGLETFSQLFFRARHDGNLYIRGTTIRDFPRFPHRGILIDTSRHYIQMDTIKDVLEAMSYNKMNVLHWHIVDDNSFPYKSKVYPKLSEMGAFHPSLVYTLDDIQQLVQFARDRGIRVVPEFDTPGHMFSWLGYPEIKAKCYHDNVPHVGPVGPIDPTKNESYAFMQNLFREIFAVFSDRFVHLGGDELQSTCWATNPEIRQYLEKNAGIPKSEAANGRNYVDKALGYYFKRLITTLSEAARDRPIGKTSFMLWEDVYKNTKEIPKDAILQVWMGKPSRVKELNDAGYQALYSSCWYLDHVKYGVEWTNYYTCEPSPYATADEERGKLLGGEACLWAEFITTETLMTQMWPRASAVAERLWSDRRVNHVESAGRRLQEHRCRMLGRALPVGQISGPDYCLRNTASLTDDDDDKHTFHRAETHYGTSIVAKYSEFLPLLNLIITCVGVTMVIVAARMWRLDRLRRHCITRSPTKA